MSVVWKSTSCALGSSFRLLGGKWTCSASVDGEFGLDSRLHVIYPCRGCSVLTYIYGNISRAYESIAEQVKIYRSNCGGVCSPVYNEFET